MNAKFLCALALTLSTPSFALNWESIVSKAVEKATAAAIDHYDKQPTRRKGTSELSKALPTQLQGAVFSTSFSGCRQLFLNGVPPQVTNPKGADLRLREICFDDFAVLHSGSLKTGYFCAERIDYTNGVVKQRRTDRFYPEARLPSSERAELSDYAGSGFDRGHLCAARFRTNENAMAQSFSLANMTPQAPGSNQGSWRDNAEGAIAKWAMRTKSPIYVVTGVFLDPSDPIRAQIKSVTAPPAYYKAAYEPKTGKRIVLWSYNDNEAQVNSMPYEELVARTGINFFPALSN